MRLNLFFFLLTQAKILFLTVTDGCKSILVQELSARAASFLFFDYIMMPDAPLFFYFFFFFGGGQDTEQAAQIWIASLSKICFKK